VLDGPGRPVCTMFRGMFQVVKRGCFTRAEGLPLTLTWHNFEPGKRRMNPRASPVYACFSRGLHGFYLGARTFLAQARRVPRRAARRV